MASAITVDGSLKTTVKYRKRVQDFFKKNGAAFDENHTYVHALAVAGHCIRALQHYATSDATLTMNEWNAVVIAAFLHDVDDRKFTKSVDYENAREMISDEDSITQELIIKMIDLVSCSKNGNRTDPNLPIWMYYPRWADRLESLGEQGVKTCESYNDFVGRAYYNEHTPRITNMEELKRVAPPERFENYINSNGGSGSGTTTFTMIDHYYDKLVHLCVKTGNTYFDKEFEERMRPIYDVVFEFGRTGTYVKK